MIRSSTRAGKRCFSNKSFNASSLSTSRPPMVTANSALSKRSESIAGPLVSKPTQKRALSSSRSSSFATPTSVPPSPNSSSQKPSPGPTSLSSSLERLLPTQADESLPSGLSRESAEKIIQTTLEALLESTSVSSLQEGKLSEEKLRKTLLDILPQSEPLSILHSLSLHILRASSDPRKHPIAHRLFHFSSGLDPYEFALGWHSNSSDSSQVFKPLGLDGSPKGENGPLENLVKNRGDSSRDLIGSNLHAPSLSLFSSLILAQSAPPPPGTSSLPDKNLQMQMRLAQRSAALRIYARLAEAGDDGGALFGWGMARLQALERSQIGTSGGVELDESKKKEREEELKQILELWQKAAEKGVKEGWFELGRLHLAGIHLPKNEKLALDFFEKGAEAGNVRSHHALGVLHGQVDPSSGSISTSEKAEKLQKSYHHFLAAAEMGDAQSAHNVGVRHLLVEVPFPQEDSEGTGSVNGSSASSPTLGEGGIGMSQEEKKLEEALRDAIISHEERWGVKPDDEAAKKWFGVASKGGFVPSMLNLASLLISGRGSGHILDPSTIDPMPSSAPSSETQLSPRLEELRQAETLYMRVIGMSGMGGATPASGAAKSPNQEMAEFAQEALEGVRDMIKEEMKKY